MRRTVPLILAAMTIATAAALPAAAAPSAVTGLTATVSGGAVSVSGTAAFGGESPVAVGSDVANDNLGGAQTAPLGVDLVGMSIAQADPNNPTLTFTIDLSSLAQGGTPEHVAYNWDIRIDGGSAAGGSDLSLKSWRTRVATTTNLNPYAAVFTCVPSPTGGSSCTPGPQVPVTYDTAASEVRLSVPLASINANPGSTIDAWNRISSPVWTGGTAGTQTLAGLYDISTHSRYTVPTSTVKLGIAPAGSPISYTAAAALSGSSFSGSLSVPGPGTYDVGAQACFAANCATATTTITV